MLSFFHWNSHRSSFYGQAEQTELKKSIDNFSIKLDSESIKMTKHKKMKENDN